MKNTNFQYFNSEPTKIKWGKKNGKNARLSKRSNEEIQRPERTKPLYPASEFFKIIFISKLLIFFFLIK